MEEIIKRDYVFRGRLVTLRVDTVRLQGGRETTREIIEHPGAVVIVAVNAEGQVLLVRQYRSAVTRSLLELPAGTLEKGERPDNAAPRELQEETGYSARRWEPIAHFFSSPGILTEEMHVYLARDLVQGTQSPMDDEDLELEIVPWSEALARIERGEIVDAKSIVGLMTADKYFGQTGTP